VTPRQLIGAATLACVVCCIGPLLSVLGGIAALGVLSRAFIGIGGLAIAVVAVLGVLVVRGRRRRCAISEFETPVTLTTRRELP
jgi:hypothetical protein